MEGFSNHHVCASMNLAVLREESGGAGRCGVVRSRMECISPWDMDCLCPWRWGWRKFFKFEFKFDLYFYKSLIFRRSNELLREINWLVKRHKNGSILKCRWKRDWLGPMLSFAPYGNTSLPEAKCSRLINSSWVDLTAAPSQMEAVIDHQFNQWC